jgi:hypothetical protein
MNLEDAMEENARLLETIDQILIGIVQASYLDPQEGQAQIRKLVVETLIGLGRKP